MSNPFKQQIKLTCRYIFCYKIGSVNIMQTAFSSFDTDRLDNLQIYLQIAYTLRMPLHYLIFLQYQSGLRSFQLFLLPIDISFGWALASSRTFSGGMVVAVTLFQVVVESRLHFSPLQFPYFLFASDKSSWSVL